MKKQEIPVIINLIPILFLGVLTIYFTTIIIKYPLVGIVLKEENNQWVVEGIYEKGWAANQPIKKGHIVKYINSNDPDQHPTVILFNRIELASSVVIMDEKMQSHTLEITYRDLEGQLILYLLLPFLFTVTVLSLCVFLYFKKGDNQSATVLIYFLIMMGTCYLSAPISARGDIPGRLINTISFSGSIILFAHFLRSYLIRWDIEFIKIQSLINLYVFNFTVVFITIFKDLLLYKTPFRTELIELAFFVLLVCYLVFSLCNICFQDNSSEGKRIIKILLLTLLMAFFPFVFLSALPDLLFQKKIISAEFTAMFLIVIPLSFVYLQLAERLFEIELLITRLRYYSLLALPISLIILFVYTFIGEVALFTARTLLVFVLLFIGVVLSFYVKEYLDYKFRHYLFSPKNNFEASLHVFFQRAKFDRKVSDLVSRLENEIKDVLFANNVGSVELLYDDKNNSWKVKDEESYVTTSKDLYKLKWDEYQTGILFERECGFGVLISKHNKIKRVILFDMKYPNAKLNIQEKMWLETIVYYSSIILENISLIEDLNKKLDEYKEGLSDKKTSPSWFSRLMFSMSEKERATLSTDLHDTVLQEQLFLLREIENITEKSINQMINKSLLEMRERILDSIHLLRETCNELRPPFLREAGIIQTIEQLIEKTKLRCNFILKSEMDYSIEISDQETELALYRVVQEMLNNAMKHSNATEVTISLNKQDEVVSLAYSDNGKGMDIGVLEYSFKTMGIIGMKERIQSIGGLMEIQSTIGKGTYILIKVKG